MKKISTLILISAFTIGSSHAQGVENLYRMSNQNFGTATARSAGMGGAFTSLGADVASMSINPAGLGMYSRSEISISPGLRFNKITSAYEGLPGFSGSNDGHRANFNIGSFGAVYSNGRFALGIGSNRLANFNTRRTIYGGNEIQSLGEVFVEQLYGVSESQLQSTDDNFYIPFYNLPVSLWGAIMGYQAVLIDPTDIDGVYTIKGILNSGDKVMPQFNRLTKGAIDEYTISGAYNYDNLLYFGMTIGIQDISYRQFDTYSEVTDLSNTGALDEFTYRNNLRVSGTGVNLKFGVTARPVSWFRVGVSYHSPTWMSLREESFSDLSVYGSQIPAGSPRGFSDTPMLLNDALSRRSPSRLLAGVSFTIADMVIISADYERTWYGKMKNTETIRYSDFRPETLSDAIDNQLNIANNTNAIGEVGLNAIIGNSYRATHNVRIGVEAQPIPKFFIRAGYGYNQSPYRSAITTYSGKKASDYGVYQQVSGGLGYRTGSFSVDLAYVYGFTKNLPYKFFDYTAGDGFNVSTAGYVTTKQRNSNIILSFGFRF